MRMGSCVLFMNSNRYNGYNLSTTVADRFPVDIIPSAVFRITWWIGIYNNSWYGFRVNGWSHKFYFLSMTSTHKFRQLLNIFRVTSSASEILLGVVNTTRVYCRYHWCGDFYIGSTEHSVFDREQSKIRKYGQFQANQVEFYEQALKLWHRLQNLFEFCTFLVWIHPHDGTTLLTKEQLFQQTFRPICNWPWIHPVLKRKWTIGKQLFGPKLKVPDCIPGRKMVRKFRKRHRGQLFCTLSQQLDNNIKIYKFLYALGSNSRQKFDCSI